MEQILEDTIWMYLQGIRLNETIQSQEVTHTLQFHLYNILEMTQL